MKLRAKTDLYELGTLVPANTKSGFELDRSKPRNEHDIKVVNKGDFYYTWHHRHYQPIRAISLTPPKRSDLVFAAQLKEVYRVQEELDEYDYDSIILVEFIKQVKEWIKRVEIANNIYKERFTTISKQPITTEKKVNRIAEQCRKKYLQINKWIVKWNDFVFFLENTPDLDKNIDLIDVVACELSDSLQLDD